MSMINYIKLPLLLIGIALLAGCATSIKYTISGDDIVKKSNFDLVDKRDEVQKKPEIMSLSLSNCWYGIYRLGDEQIVPDRLAILSKELQEKVGQKLEGKKVIVHRFEIYNNVQSQLRGSVVMGSPAGLLGFVITRAIVNNACSAVLAPEKNPSNKAAVIVDIEVDVDGKIIKDKIVQLEPEDDLTERVKRAVFATVKKIVDIVSE